MKRSTLFSFISLIAVTPSVTVHAEVPVCRVGLANDGNAYEVCETVSTVTLARATSTEAPHDDVIAMLVDQLDNPLVAPLPRNDESRNAEVPEIGGFARFGLSTSMGDSTPQAWGTIGFFYNFHENMRFELASEINQIYSRRTPEDLQFIGLPAVASFSLQYENTSSITPFVFAGVGLAYFRDSSQGLESVELIEPVIIAGAGLEYEVADKVSVETSLRWSRQLQISTRERAFSEYELRMGLRFSLN